MNNKIFLYLASFFFILIHLNLVPYAFSQEENKQTLDEKVEDFLEEVFEDVKNT